MADDVFRHREGGRHADDRHVETARRGKGRATRQRHLRRRQGGRFVHQDGDAPRRGAGVAVAPVGAVDGSLRRQCAGAAHALALHVQHGHHVYRVGVVAPDVFFGHFMDGVVAGHDAGTGGRDIDALDFEVRAVGRQRVDQAADVRAAHRQRRRIGADVAQLDAGAAGGC